MTQVTYAVTCKRLAGARVEEYVEYVTVRQLGRHQFEATSPAWGNSKAYPDERTAALQLAYSAAAAVKSAAIVPEGFEAEAEAARRREAAATRAELVEQVSASIAGAQAALDLAEAEAFHLVTDDGMAVRPVPGKAGSFRLTVASGDCADLFKAERREAAERLAVFWNRRLTAEQIKYGCTVRVLRRRATLEQVIGRGQDLLATLEGLA